jgi:hypothetical protein
MVDPNEYLGAKPTAYSRVHLEYEPSPALRGSISEFIKPELRTKKRIAQIALRSESFAEIPVIDGGQTLEHSPDLTNYLYNYQSRLDEIQDRQLRLAAFVDMQILKHDGLLLHFELLPDDYERRRLGRLALNNNNNGNETIGAAVYIPHDLINHPHAEAVRRLRGALAMAHPAIRDRQHSTPAPLENGLWVRKPTLRDRPVLRVVKTAAEIQQSETN